MQGNGAETGDQVLSRQGKTSIAPFVGTPGGTPGGTAPHGGTSPVRQRQPQPPGSIAIWERDGYLASADTMPITLDGGVY